MRAAIAILLSSLMLWTGVIAAAPAPSAVKRAPCCRVCDCPTSCCAQKTEPNSAPLAPPRTATQTEASVLLALASFSLTLPASSSVPPSVSPAPFRAEAPPLYTRHCALLI